MRFVLLTPTIMLGVALLWYAIYEGIAFVVPSVPTISSILRPFIHDHIVASVFVLMMILGFIAGLIYDLFISKP